MTIKTVKPNKKPILIAVGDHMIDPNDVACITRVKHGGLYVVRLKSQPNMEYPIWVKKNQIDVLVAHFNIIVSDTEEAEG